MARTRSPVYYPDTRNGCTHNKRLWETGTPYPSNGSTTSAELALSDSLLNYLVLDRLTK